MCFSDLQLTTDGIPSAATAAAVKTYIDARRPVAAVAASLADLIRRQAEPGGTLLISHIREAISTAAGEHDHELISPAADVTHATGHIAVMGRITWQ